MHPLQSERLAVKLYLQPPAAVDQQALIPVFHRWIREKRIDGHLLIDVTDYSHVPNGPGVMLIAHEGHFGMDEGRGHPGLLYSRKRALPGEPAANLREVLRSALQACAALEDEPSLEGRLRFETRSLRWQIVDRLLAPNDEPTFVAVAGPAGEALSAIYGKPVQITRTANDPRAPFDFVSECAEAPRPKELLGALR